MDDDLVLNLASDDSTPNGKGKSSARKGGRWTERLKAKRVAKRKARPGDLESVNVQPEVAEERPSKRPRTAAVAPSNHDRPAAPSRPSTQIISSLFSYNPTVNIPDKPKIPKSLARPSNAPLTDSSSFAGLGVDPLLVTHLSNKMDISKPTSIQRATLTAMLSSSGADKDIFIQSQTGSGKTLSFLIPIIQDLLPLSSLSYIDRSIGTLAIIIAPTRELAKQISDVLEALLKMRLRPEDESASDASSTRLTRWLVSGLLTGGATRTHEKARLRKGLPIIVSTPGRLLDHLQNSASFNVGKCRWLVLDEADRLMELGFEETITGILNGLNGRRNLAIQAAQEGVGRDVGGWNWERRRRTVLCSATIREDVQKLAGVALVEPLMIKGFETDPQSKSATSKNTPPEAASGPEQFTPPSQLSQKYVVVPLKLRLVVLVALLRTLIAQSQRGNKVVVFFSCTDSVDFHWQLLGGSMMQGDVSQEDGSDDDSDDQNEADAEKEDKQIIEVQSPLLPDTSIYRLHGSLATRPRLASLRGFSNSGKLKSSTHSSILFCTSVASRGLDLPLVRAVVQYDLPTEGGETEYVHRVGRTARAGKGGEAWSIVAPSEAEWIKWIEGKMNSDDKQGKVSLEGTSVDTLLQSGFGGKGSESEGRATDVQLSFERWVLSKKDNISLARKAFLSHMRAYATHPSSEKHIFHVRHLHIGHLAKAFALRDAPKTITGSGQSQGKKSGGKKGIRDARHKDIESRMTEVVRSQGRLSKKGGVMNRSGTSEFQIAGGDALEKLVNRMGS
ncbi:P-loop containing nucleoside triphosphate hydrolase protein [Desarmillaria tabescens]|uniref:ATP-dependent RNA helicase n=1 Tax=Armillaria tabescens TaxID=1929756 RepID=A0AA39N912_ARMTA|nr:P-loop containing nucleoside triphosphate hydrolase protein [Desarmillaria tabescens]KAK0461244.1 P-loop containing nucleoside triphosphate hydrolase protein [Desarmillaria tabescens]